MRTCLAVWVGTMILSSCSKYQYLKLSSGDTKFHQTNEFIAENDTFRVVYRFHGPMDIGVVNKSSIPLAIDWSKSFLFRQKGSLKSYKLLKHFDRTNSLKYGVEPIPSYAGIYREGISFRKERFISLHSYPIKKTRIKKGRHSGKVKSARIPRDKSPLAFRVYLTLFPEGRESQPVIVDHSFYLSEIVATHFGPGDMPETEQEAIVLKKRTVAGIAVRTIFEIPLTILLVVLAQQLNANADNQ